MVDAVDLKSLSEDDFNTLEKVVDILFPSEPDGTGAVSAGVVTYIDRVLSGRAAHLLDTYRTGLRWLHDEARARGSARFDEIDRMQQEEIVDAAMSRSQATSPPLDSPTSDVGTPGERADKRPSVDILFMTALWQHTREGLFGDPRHGGNREGIIWRWLGYSGPQLHGYTDSEILANETPRRPLRFADDWNPS